MLQEMHQGKSVSDFVYELGQYAYTGTNIWGDESLQGIHVVSQQNR